MKKRIIPACAGSTWIALCLRSARKDHPRIRGVYRATISWGPWKVGSSPHTRGLLRHQRSADGQLGIIPAYAGSTYALGFSCICNEDHPRIRGVYPTN